MFSILSFDGVRSNLTLGEHKNFDRPYIDMSIGLEFYLIIANLFSYIIYMDDKLEGEDYRSYKPLITAAAM
jgi:hypothetical protein